MKKILIVVMTGCFSLILATAIILSSPIPALADVCSSTNCSDGTSITCCGHSSSGLDGTSVTARDSAGNVTCSNKCKSSDATLDDGDW